MATKKRTDQISGKHKSVRMILSEGIVGEFEEWRALAERAGTNLSEWIRKAARDRARKEK